MLRTCAPRACHLRVRGDERLMRTGNAGGRTLHDHVHAENIEGEETDGETRHAA